MQMRTLSSIVLLTAKSKISDTFAAWPSCARNGITSAERPASSETLLGVPDMRVSGRERVRATLCRALARGFGLCPTTNR